MQKLPKINRVNVSDQVYDLLKGHIVQGKLKAGDKLPSENELCAMMGVSRPTVNAAVNRLRAMGLVEVRPGDGSYVKYFSSVDYIQNYADLVMDTQNISEILEIRWALDVESFRLAMDRATEEDMKALEEISERIIRAHKEKDLAVLEEYDFAFHLQICKCSKNRYFTMLYELIGSVLRKQMGMFSVSANKWLSQDDKIIDDHAKIYQALRDRDFNSYLMILNEHTDYETHKD